jgi:O-succinylbenzoic acid--CoA ligase
VPDDEWGMVVAAAVVVRGDEPALDALKAAVVDGVGRAAVPKLVRFVSELPLRGPGTVDRTAVLHSFR